MGQINCLSVLVVITATLVLLIMFRVLKEKNVVRKKEQKAHIYRPK